MIGETDDMLKIKVIKSLRLGSQDIQSATESETRILRIDDIIVSKGIKDYSSKSKGIDDMRRINL